MRVDVFDFWMLFDVFGCFFWGFWVLGGFDLTGVFGVNWVG